MKGYTLTQLVEMIRKGAADVEITDLCKDEVALRREDSVRDVYLNRDGKLTFKGNDGRVKVWTLSDHLGMAALRAINSLNYVSRETD
jgi:hypothetical protein